MAFIDYLLVSLWQPRYKLANLVMNVVQDCPEVIVKVPKNCLHGIFGLCTGLNFH